MVPNQFNLLDKKVQGKKKLKVYALKCEIFTVSFITHRHVW